LTSYQQKTAKNAYDLRYISLFLFFWYLSLQVGMILAVHATMWYFRKSQVLFSEIPNFFQVPHCSSVVKTTQVLEITHNIQKDTFFDAHLRQRATKRYPIAVEPHG
jgi:hypothetical protein